VNGEKIEIATPVPRPGIGCDSDAVLVRVSGTGAGRIRLCRARAAAGTLPAMRQCLALGSGALRRIGPLGVGTLRAQLGEPIRRTEERAAGIAHRAGGPCGASGMNADA
jgi:hypothetical protein